MRKQIEGEANEDQEDELTDETDTGSIVEKTQEAIEAQKVEHLGLATVEARLAIEP